MSASAPFAQWRWLVAYIHGLMDMAQAGLYCWRWRRLHVQLTAASNAVSIARSIQSEGDGHLQTAAADG